VRTGEEKRAAGNEERKAHTPEVARQAARAVDAALRDDAGVSNGA